MAFRKLLTARWIVTTLLVIAAILVMVRLGFWQLDRLTQRRAANARVAAQVNAPPLNLNQVLADGTLTLDELNNMQYRSVVIHGEYHPQEEVVLRNRVWQNLPGFHLLTPFYIQGTPYAVMVDRGWIPLDQSKPQQWKAYDQPGVIEIRGQI